MKTGDNKEKNNTEKYIVILLGFILFVLCVITAIMLIPKECCCTVSTSVQNKRNSVDGGVGMLIDSNAEDSVKDQSIDGEQGVAISGFSTITVPQGEKNVTVNFYNPDKNADMYYQTFELRLIDDSGYETLYTSGLVEPGKRIEHITLSRGLESGVYQAVVHVQPYCMDEDRTPTNNADIKTELIVE